jgi:hypothetical protein
MKINENKESVYIEMKELADLINAKDWRTAQKWCQEFNLPTINIGKSKMTFRIMATSEIDRQVLNALKLKHPQNWETLFKHFKNKDYLEYVLATCDENPVSFRSVQKSTPKSRFAKAFAKD